MVSYQRSYLKEDWDFLRKFPRSLPTETDLYTCDIVSLYTNISHELGIQALSYWTEKLRHLIPERFTIDFILDSTKFILSNNYFKFDSMMYLQLIGTAIGTIFAPPYACLTVGFLEETKLYPLVRNHFPFEIAEFIVKFYLRYMDDGITPLPSSMDLESFSKILNCLDQRLKFTIEKAVEENDNGKSFKVLSFLDVSLKHHRDGTIETDVFYKSTNNHDYLDYFSHHPQHVKDNITFNLAKRIVIFCSDPIVEKQRLKELRHWLLACNYPEKLINDKFFKAKLQGPAPNPETPKVVVPFVTTHFSNYDAHNIIEATKSLLKSSTNERVRTVYKDIQPILSLRQPKNLLRQLTHAEFRSTTLESSNQLQPGLFKCKSNSCRLCRDGYIQECASFETSNGVEWQIKCHINCNSSNVLYFLKCTACKSTTYTGKTNNLRLRMNGHKSSATLGNSTDVFDNHVHKCRNRLQYTLEPKFLIYAFLRVNDSKLLIPYEKFFHSQHFDTLN